MFTYLKDLISNSPDKVISYADYMAAVLYHPELGYYMKNKEKIGRKGDFITTSNISDIYGRIMAKWYSNVSKITGLPPAICEIGAGNGRFAKAFLQEWKDRNESSLAYYIVESSPYHQKMQRRLLNPDFTFNQLHSIGEIKGFEGMIFSNELFDALPVHVIEKIDSHLYEVMVGEKNNGLIEVRVPLTNPDILAFLNESQIDLHDRQRLEVPLSMGKMVHDISKSLSKGLVVTADYGYTNEEWMEPARAKGSLRGYYQHQMIHNVLQNPGEMDITSHIHFDYFINKGEQLGLRNLAKLRQDEFLIKAGALEELENHYDSNPFSDVSKRNRAIRSLIMPSGISSFFHIIIQEKGLNPSLDQLFH